MSRWALAACLSVVMSVQARAAGPKPLWEIDVSAGDRATSPDWLEFSPDGTAVVAVVARGITPTGQCAYTLKVWDSATRKERFTADLGTARGPSAGEPLVAFPTPDSILTGGPMLVTRDLKDGREQGQRFGGAGIEHGVWAVPDLRETFQLRRDPSRHGEPIELRLHGNQQQVNEFSRRPIRGDTGNRAALIEPVRDGLRAEGVALNPGRTRAAVAFRDETVGRGRHALVLYRIVTVEEFRLDWVAIADDPHPGAVTAVTFAPNGKTVATGGEDGSVCLWDADRAGAGWKPTATISGVADFRVYALAFRPDWKILAAATWDKTKPNLLLIDADEGKLVRAVRLERGLTALAFSQDGRTLLTGGISGKIQAWDAETLLRGDGR